MFLLRVGGMFFAAYVSCYVSPIITTHNTSFLCAIIIMMTIIIMTNAIIANMNGNYLYMPSFVVPEVGSFIKAAMRPPVERTHTPGEQ